MGAFGVGSGSLLTGSCRSGFYSLCREAKGFTMVSVNCYSQVPQVKNPSALELMENVQRAPSP